MGEPVKALAAFVGVLAFLTAGVAACRKAQAVSATAGTEQPDPYALMKQAFFDHPEQFEFAMARAAEAGVRRNLSDARLTFEERAVVTNLGQALRAIVAYRAEMPAPEGGTQSIDAERRQYIHPWGAVIVETACVSGARRCQLPRELIDRTDATVLQQLSGEGVSALLPPDAECETSPVPMRSHVNRVTVCRLGRDVRVSVMRLSRDQTLAEFN
jgi:hypothetical protein